MNDEPSRSRSELWLARQLQQAARLEEPQFSEALYNRVMDAVRPAVVEMTAERSMRAKPVLAVNARNDALRRRERWLAAAWLTSAAALLAIVFSARWFSGPDDRDRQQQPQSAATQSALVQPGPDANQVVATGNSKPAKPSSADAAPDDIASLAANYTLDDLSHDAQATAHVLVDQLPFETPTDEWGL
jgi:type IV secretory pathway VirB10-like protein